MTIKLFFDKSRAVVMMISFLSLFGCVNKSQREWENRYGKKGLEEIHNMFEGDLNVLFHDFDENMRHSTSIDKLTEIRSQVANHFGKIKKINKINIVQTKDKSNDDIFVSRYRIECKNGKLQMIITFNRADQIVGMWVNPE
jgi:hypothetical protein